MYVYLVNIPEPVKYVIYAVFDLRCQSGTSQIKGYALVFTRMRMKSSPEALLEEFSEYTIERL